MDTKSTDALLAEMVEDAPKASDPFPQHRDSWWSKLLVLAFVALPLLAFVYAITTFWGAGVGLFEILLLVGMWTFTGLGISLGFHRMLTHRAYTATAPTRAVLLVAGTMAMQGPAADWAATHIRHHAKADREGDPHSPLEGFWHAHFGWLVRDRFVRSGIAHDKLMADPVVAFISKTWTLWATLGMLIPAGIGYLYYGTLGGAFAGFLWGSLVRVFLGHHITWSVNSVAHMFGTRPFATTDQARNNALLAPFSWGEGWHNNHHAFPRAAYIGIRWYQFDIGKYTLFLLKWTRQVRNIHMPTKAERKAKMAARKEAKAKATSSSN
ncbi:MAG TPA: acyl-CoA desaturase [Candidatus Thermoplasmatota archaeon]|nr:acyl-CoA desaturase [Candidatus Thermoplasmatota archaeon]